MVVEEIRKERFLLPTSGNECIFTKEGESDEVGATVRPVDFNPIAGDSRGEKNQRENFCQQ